MNKIELVSAIAEKSGLTKKDAEAALDATVDAISGALIEGDKVQLIGFGSFESKRRAQRKGFNPVTKEPKIIPETVVPTFKPGKALKDAVAKK